LPEAVSEIPNDGITPTVASGYVRAMQRQIEANDHELPSLFENDVPPMVETLPNINPLSQTQRLSPAMHANDPQNFGCVFPSTFNNLSLPLLTEQMTWQPADPSIPLESSQFGNQDLSENPLNPASFVPNTQWFEHENLSRDGTGNNLLDNGSRTEGQSRLPMDDERNVATNPFEQLPSTLANGSVRNSNFGYPAAMQEGIPSNLGPPRFHQVPRSYLTILANNLRQDLQSMDLLLGLIQTQRETKAEALQSVQQSLRGCQ